MVPSNTKNLNLCLGWDTECDVDASIICTNEEGSMIDECYFGKKVIPGFKHAGDNLTGEGEGDDETISI